MESKVVKREACPECRDSGGDSSGDNLAVYDDGHVHCFACGYHRNSDGTVIVEERPDPVPRTFKPLIGKVVALDDRHITEDTCRKYDYRVAKVNGQLVQVANYVRDGELMGQKVRLPDKIFRCNGNMTDTPLFGQHLFKAGGRYLTICEGEIDTLSMSQAWDNKWPVVGLPTGAAGAARAIRNNLEWINSFEEVRFCFDMDEPGQAAALECAMLLRPGKAQIVQLPDKDVNDCIANGLQGDLINAWWNAVTYRPDGIIHVKEVDVTKDLEFSKIWPYPWDCLTKQLYGRKSPELVMHTSGSGMGKSTFLRKMIHFDLINNEKVGVMMLEESVKDTVQHLMANLLNKPVRQIIAARQLNEKLVEAGHEAVDFGVEDNLTDEELVSANQQLVSTGDLYLLDHFGALDCDSLIDKLDYMRTGLGCDKIYIDHISIIVSGMESGNERKDIDILMTRLRQFCQRADCHIDAVCHLTKPKGVPFEEGGQISLRDFRGSGALYQLADVCLAYERNQQHKDPDTANTVVIRTLKDRFTGNAGICGALRYDKTTGGLDEVDWGYDDDGNVIFGTQSENPVSYADIIEDDSSVYDDEEVLV